MSQPGNTLPVGGPIWHKDIVSILRFKYMVWGQGCLVVRGQLEPLIGCAIAYSTELGRNDYIAVIIGGPIFAFTHCRADSTKQEVRLYKEGARVAASTGVLQALGILPNDGELLDVAIPLIPKDIAEALVKAGI